MSSERKAVRMVIYPVREIRPLPHDKEVEGR